MKKTGFYWGVAALICATTLFSCKSDDEKLGLNTGTSPEVMVIDTFTLFTRTLPEDSFATSNLSLQILGALNSTVYGKSTAGIAVNFTLPSSSNFTFPAGSTIDSVFLVMSYSGEDNFQGNPNTPITLNAYEVSEVLSPDSQYYSRRNISYNPAPIGTLSTKLNVKDSVSITFNGTTTKEGPQLRLKLNNASFGTKIINGAAANFATNTAFQDFIRGIRVEADNSTLPQDDGAAAYMNLTSGISGIRVYYNDTQQVLFPINKDNSAFANLFNHNFAGTSAQTQFTVGANYDECYLQSMAGTRVLIQIPGLDNFAKDSRYAIVGANLTVSSNALGIGAGFDAPTRLLLLFRDSTDEVSLVADAISEADLFDGKYNSDRQQYTFNIPRHLQYVVNENRNHGINYNKGFYLRIPSDNPITAGHLTLDTRKGIERGIKLRLHVIKVR